MRRPRIISLLESLKPVEIKRFQQYVESGFFNQNQRLIKLSRYLIRKYPRFLEKGLTNEKLFEVLFGKEETFEEQHVYDHLSQLRKLLEGFLSQVDFEENENARNRHLLNALSTRQQGEHFLRISRRVEKQLQKQGPENRQYYLNRFLMLEQQVSYLQRARKRKADNKLEETMKEMVGELDRHYLATKLMLSCEMLNRSQIVKSDYPFPVLAEIQQYLASPDQHYKETPVIAIYFVISKMLTEENAAIYFEELVDLLNLHSEALSRTEEVAMYAFAQNFCIRNINEGGSAYLRKLFALYQQMLERKILIESDGFLAHWNYKNIATVGLRLGDYDWVKSFNESYQEFLSPEYRENAYNYNLAAYYYETKAYKSAMQLLQQVEFSDIYYHLSAKSTLVKIYFELEEDDSLSYLILAFQALLRRNRHIPRSTVELYENLLRFVRQAQRLRSRKGNMDSSKFHTQSQQLLEKISQEKRVANVNWLKDQITLLNRDSSTVPQ